MSFLRLQKVDLIEKRLFFRQIPFEQGGCLGSHSLNVSHSQAWYMDKMSQQIKKLTQENKRMSAENEQLKREKFDLKLH